MEFITERLYIRPVSADDKESMFRYRSDSGTNKYLSLVPLSFDDVVYAILDREWKQKHSEKE